MVSKPKKNCIGCPYSRMQKGARCYCTLRQMVIPPEEMVLVEHCSHAAAAKRKAELLVEEAKRAREAKQLDREPLRATG